MGACEHSEERIGGGEITRQVGVERVGVGKRDMFRRENDCDKVNGNEMPIDDLKTATDIAGALCGRQYERYVEG